MSVITQTCAGMAVSGTRRPVAVTPRELQLAELVAMGRRNKEIAYETNLHEPTVKQKLSVLFAKLGVTNRAELAVWFVRQGSGLLEAARAGQTAPAGAGHGSGGPPARPYPLYARS